MQRETYSLLVVTLKCKCFCIDMQVFSSWHSNARTSGLIQMQNAIFILNGKLQIQMRYLQTHFRFVTD